MLKVRFGGSKSKMNVHKPLVFTWYSYINAPQYDDVFATPLNVSISTVYDFINATDFDRTAFLNELDNSNLIKIEAGNKL